MSVPLSLRVCCMAAMAPALTEAATQARIKLSESPPPAPPELPTPLLNGNGLTHHKTEKIPAASSERDRLGAPCAKGKQGRGIVGFTSHLTLQQLQQAHKQGLLKPVGCKQITAANLKHLKLVQKLPQISQEHSLSFSVLEQNSNQIDADEKMNKTNSVIETKSTGKQGGLISQIKREDFQVPEKRNISNNKQSLNVKELSSGVDIQHTSSSNKETEHKVEVPVNNLISSSGSDMVASMGNGPDVSETPISKSKEQTETVCELGAKQLKLSEQVGRKQHVLERRTQALLRRLRRIQGNHLESHVRNQLSSFVNFQNSNLQTVAKTIKSNNSNNNDLKTDLFQSEDVKNLSTAALVNLVRKLQSSNNNNKTSLQRLVSQTKTEKDIVSQGVLSIDEETCIESSRVAGHLTMNLKHAQSAIDSDATESSSGGESCDEDDIYYDRDPKATLNPLHRRAEWKWATDRAAVASRWTWLQAQVSDLEYRIRQQSEIFKQIRHTKGSVILGEAPTPEDLSVRLKQVRAADSKLSPLDAKIANLQKKNEASPCNISTLLMNVNVQASKLTKSLGNCLSPAQEGGNSNNIGDGKLRGQQNHSTKPLNGMIGQSHEHGASGMSSDAPSTPQTTQGAIGPTGDSVASTPEVPTSPFPPDMTCQAARCRPVRSYRKRKLLWTSGLHQRSRKAARLSTVRCECYPPKSSCPMCGGRYNNTQSVNPDNMPIQERVSILDPAFHPVLSFTQEIPLPIHFEALLKSGEWQNKPPPKSAKALATERRRQKLMSQQRVSKKTKYAKGAAAALLSSAKLRNKYERRTPTKPRSGGLSMTPKKSAKERRLARSDMKRRRVAQLAMALKHNENLSLSYTDGYSGVEGKNMLASPINKEGGTLSSSAPSSTLKEMKEAQWRRRRESEYDINNIVIPYSMAASTRVEKLQYKEIVTPKWRDLTKGDGEVQEEEEEETCPSKEEMETETERPASQEEANVTKEGEEEEEEVEDLTDESFIERHKICEVQEKKRFTSFIQYPSRRQRGSRGEEQPRTPAMTDDIPMDISVNEPILPLTSPLSTSPSPTPQVQAFKDEAFRRRSSSASSRRLSMSASMDENSRDSQLYETVEMCSVDPWPDRTFPLTEEEYEQMKMVQPPAVHVRRARMSSTRISLMSEYSSSHHQLEDSMSGSSLPCSPLPSTSSGSVVGEDPNDPEWIINGEKDKEKAPPKQSVILKLKR
ncbi:KAT8 regulatory NSL complex subunit 1-like [Ylistrum balloti]|uniref:KAT8 regulatory NSL complex subunit 1-like n=1 Tax=Ylistrum balloti TaxID=509963 RepID=UPI002905D136|nr:KAT8 regulatory NSL complex subunit 1-like [Ylistrum balloti]